MDASQPLTIESFSYRWLVNLKPSQEGRTSLDMLDEASSFIEMDPNLPASKRFYRKSNSCDFKFDFPTSPAPLTLVHADDLFSGGYVLPIFADPVKIRSYEAEFGQTSVSSYSSHPPKFYTTESKICSPSLRRYGRLSKQVFHKYFHLFRPLCQIIQRCKSSSKSRDSRKARASMNCVHPEDSSPRLSSAYSVGRMSYDSDCSIYEAVLHCKRSFGK